jgi:cytochrome c-type biogenesis protein CcmH
MTVWVIFAGMTAVVMALLALPFLKAPKLRKDVDFVRAIYRDQLDEVGRDADRGLIGAAEAEAARNEISRRLLQTTEGERNSSGGHSKVMAAAVLLVPLIAVPLYRQIGNPAYPDFPLQERLAKAVENKDFPALIASVERHLASQPDDLQGWQLLAGGYREQQRWLDAARAYANIMRLSKTSPDVVTAYGEMLVFANEGLVTAEAHKAFQEALRLDPKYALARFFDAVALKQEGSRDEAKARLAAMLAEAGPDSPYKPMVEAELRELDGSKAPVLTKEQMAEGKAMAPADQKQMIAGMIAGLEQRLGSDSKDLGGWLRLIRARAVNNEADKARNSLQLARNAFKDAPASLDQLKGLAEELGIQ